MAFDCVHSQTLIVMAATVFGERRPNRKSRLDTNNEESIQMKTSHLHG